VHNKFRTDSEQRNDIGAADVMMARNTSDHARVVRFSNSTSGLGIPRQVVPHASGCPHVVSE
jgi:hypothetical protein